jgi:hypothetical protein
MMAEIFASNIILMDNVSLFVVVSTFIVARYTHSLTSFLSFITRMPTMFFASYPDRSHICTYSRAPSSVEDLATGSHIPSMGAFGPLNLTST